MAMLNNQRVKSMVCWVLKFEPYGIASVPGSFTSAIPEDWIANRGACQCTTGSSDDCRIL